MKKTSTYNVAIIGGGRIAAGFDTPGTPHQLTHAYAITRNKHLRLLGITDTDAKIGKAAAKKWKTNFISSRDELKALCPDIVVIATPDHTHTALLEEIAKWSIPPKLVICEKPIAITKQELRALRKLSSAVPMIVNYSLRFDPLFMKLRDELKSGKWGKVISANATYTHGFFHNGSHTIDIARFFFGELRTARAAFAISDNTKQDPSLGGVATFDRCPRFYLMTGDERAFAASGFEILTEKARLRFNNFNYEFSIEKVVPDPDYKGFFALARAKTVRTGRMEALPNLYGHVVEVLDRKARPISSLSEALRSQEACFVFSDSFKK